MKLRLLSDLHHEFFEDELLYESKGEDVLVLAGDINVGVKNTSISIFKFLRHQKNIIYVPGNHEAYGTSIAEFDAGIKEYCETMKVHYLNPGYKILYRQKDGTVSTKKTDLERVRFFGGTLWTDFQNDYFARSIAKDQITDFRVISDLTTLKCIDLNLTHKKYISDVYDILPKGGKNVIVTHFLPTVECISERYRGESALNKYFANDLTDFVGNLENTTWLFGHTHNNVDITIGNTRCIANPYGYNENSTYKEMIFEI